MITPDVWKAGARNNDWSVIFMLPRHASLRLIDLISELTLNDRVPTISVDFWLVVSFQLLFFCAFFDRWRRTESQRKQSLDVEKSKVRALFFHFRRFSILRSQSSNQSTPCMQICFCEFQVYSLREVWKNVKYVKWPFIKSDPITVSRAPTKSVRNYSLERLV